MTMTVGGCAGAEAGMGGGEGERGAWVSPELTRVAASKAQYGSGDAFDGDFMFS